MAFTGVKGLNSWGLQIVKMTALGMKKKTWLCLHNIDEKQMQWMNVSLFEAATVLTPTELQCNKLLTSQALRYHIISPITMLWILLKISLTFQSGKLPLNAINLVLEELRLKGQRLFCFTVMNCIQTSKAPDHLLLAWIMTRTIINKLLYIPGTKWALVGWFSHPYSEVWTAWLCQFVGCFPVWFNF